MSFKLTFEQDKYPLETWITGALEHLATCRSCTTLTDEQSEAIAEIETKLNQMHLNIRFVEMDNEQST